MKTQRRFGGIRIPNNGQRVSLTHRCVFWPPPAFFFFLVGMGTVGQHWDDNAVRVFILATLVRGIQVVHFSTDTDDFFCVPVLWAYPFGLFARHGLAFAIPAERFVLHPIYATASSWRGAVLAFVAA